ncbi:hypothetical protein D9611_005518 [Ephemerocybe angulata]|uniref:Uncharacterized protein n=1 Tax=Ephemerocybe angulata TaxID=980116 RepID=A0A8H5BK49_9AGAR|nr:hypothetical protein D9611_005518 [Tulosesus angulatus]
MSDENTSTNPAPTDNDNDPLVLYSQALHDYTLRLWAESRRASEERQRLLSAANTRSTAPAARQESAKNDNQAKPSDSTGGGR